MAKEQGLALTGPDGLLKQVEAAACLTQWGHSVALPKVGGGMPVLEAIGLGTPVLFSGVQPAAELMVGSGSTEIEFGDLRSLFMKYSKSEEIIHLVSEIEKNKIPLWSDFSAEIERAVRKTVN